MAEHQIDSDFNVDHTPLLGYVELLGPQWFLEESEPPRTSDEWYQTIDDTLLDAPWAGLDTITSDDLFEPDTFPGKYEAVIEATFEDAPWAGLESEDFTPSFIRAQIRNSESMTLDLKLLEDAEDEFSDSITGVDTSSILQIFSDFERARELAELKKTAGKKKSPDSERKKESLDSQGGFITGLRTLGKDHVEAFDKQILDFYKDVQGIVRTDFYGEIFVPEKLVGAGLEREVGRIIFNLVDKMIYIALGIPNQNDLVGRSDIVEMEQEYLIKLAGKKYQRIRDEIRREWTREMCKNYNVEKMIISNPLRRKGSQQRFMDYFNSMAEDYFSKVKSLIDKKHSRKYRSRLKHGRANHNHHNNFPRVSGEQISTTHLDSPVAGGFFLIDGYQFIEGKHGDEDHPYTKRQYDADTNQFTRRQRIGDDKLWAIKHPKGTVRSFKRRMAMKPINYGKPLKKDPPISELILPSMGSTHFATSHKQPFYRAPNARIRQVSYMRR